MGEVGQRRRKFVSEGDFVTMVRILIIMVDLRKWSVKRIAKWRFGEGLEVVPC